MRLNLLCLALALLTGCATSPRTQIQRPADTFPADAVITQRGVLTIFGGKQFTLNGYLASSATNGQRLVVMENFGTVLADVLIKPNQSPIVMRSTRTLKREWVERFVAADMICIFGNPGTPGCSRHILPSVDCPGEMISPTHFLIKRRWYKLDLHIVEIKPGLQPAEMFAATKVEKP